MKTGINAFRAWLGTEALMQRFSNCCSFRSQPPYRVSKDGRQQYDSQDCIILERCRGLTALTKLHPPPGEWGPSAEFLMLQRPSKLQLWPLPILPAWNRKRLQLCCLLSPQHDKYCRGWHGAPPGGSAPSDKCRKALVHLQSNAILEITSLHSPLSNKHL